MKRFSLSLVFLLQVFNLINAEWVSSTNSYKHFVQYKSFNILHVVHTTIANV